jgi:peptide/nickel transport system permease protein
MWLRDTWRFLRGNVLALLGVVIVATAAIVSITAPIIAPYGPLDQDMSNRLMPPSPEHPMGTDPLGRDVLSRVIYGGRISLPIAVIIVLTALVIGVALGLVAGFFGGPLDSLLMRFTDLTTAFPPMILAMIIAAALGSGIGQAAVAIVIVWWPLYARLVRGLVLSVKHNEYVVASEAVGVRPGRILTRHVLPNCLGPAVVLATLDLGSAMLTFASLSFLGLGTAPPTPEWGAMVGKGIYFFDQWWISGFPGLAIFAVALAFNFIGDGIQDALDPRLRKGPQSK